MEDIERELDRLNISWEELIENLYYLIISMNSENRKENNILHKIQEYSERKMEDWLKTRY
jgi:hypothetical protein